MFNARMIPRYNWDYTLRDLAIAASSLATPQDDLEGSFERMLGRRPILSTSGRASLWAILKSLGLPQGSRVGVPLYCCPVVFDVIVSAGFRPEFLDIDERDYNVSAEDIRKKRARMAAVVVVHMFGNPARMDDIALAAKSLPIVEDCAQALFSRRRGEYVGFGSAVSFFSFRSGKYISAGEGSAVCCSDDALWKAIRGVVDSYPRWTLPQEAAHNITTFGKSLFYRRPLYGIVGQPLGRYLDARFNLTAKEGLSFRKISRPDARIVNRKIGTFREKVAQQRTNALSMIGMLGSLEAALPVEEDGCQYNYYQFPIRFATTQERDFMALTLLDRGIDTARYLDDVADVARSTHGYDGSCRVAEMCTKTALSIPNYYTISEEVKHIAGEILAAHEVFKNNKEAVSARLARVRDQG
jgi:perosamine synthetase